MQGKFLMYRKNKVWQKFLWELRGGSSPYALTLLLAKIIAGVRGEVLPPAEVWRQQPTR
ncbi:MAG: hypothetical protein HW380_3857, partial [Magnetococcales bacterium]|nr:hypothetical protein [Magnetococcales bacterium]